MFLIVYDPDNSLELYDWTTAALKSDAESIKHLTDVHAMKSVLVITLCFLSVCSARSVLQSNVTNPPAPGPVGVPAVRRVPLFAWQSQHCFKKLYQSSFITLSLPLV